MRRQPGSRKKSGNVGVNILRRCYVLLLCAIAMTHAPGYALTHAVLWDDETRACGTWDNGLRLVQQVSYAARAHPTVCIQITTNMLREIA
ncbi:hypothetical protein NDU88_006850 [Pleurodeles waltl]|uniref:Uncharacterized protein n=1 Tax=Pleurodeles waltl TaxID=8319 RepID=A0AAV7QL68_PLEWA|nr:hypothetical protein NDU88_006850 [Pleurodeles waltl]